MDAQDRDRALDAALDAALTDLEMAQSGSDRERTAALIAAVVLIGRRTMPGRRDKLERARTMADRAMPRTEYRLDPPLGGLPVMRQDPPRPQVRDRVAGPAPAPMNDAERAIWQRDREELVDALTLRRDLCVTLGVSPQSSDAEVRAAAMALAEDRRAMLAERDAFDARIEDLRGKVREIHTDVKTLAEAGGRAESLRDSLRAALGLRSNALDSAIIAAVNGTADVLRDARATLDDVRAKLCGVMDLDPKISNLHTEDLIERIRARIAVLLEEHQRERTAVDELRAAQIPAAMDTASARAAAKLMHARWQRIQPLITALHAVENWPRFVSAVERAKLSRFVDRIERWDRATAPDGRDVLAAVDRVTEDSVGARAVAALLREFEAWQRVESDALDAEEAQPTPALRALFGGPPVDGPDPVGALADVPDEAPQDPRDLMRRPAGLPRQPDDPGVERIVTREEVIAIARGAAAGPHRPGYFKEGEAFQPHEWVIDAMMRLAMTLGAETTP